MGSLTNRSISIRTGQCHVYRCMKPLLERVEKGEIDPRFVITHRMPLEDAPKGYSMFRNKQDNCEKIVLKPQQRHTSRQLHGRAVYIRLRQNQWR